MENQQVGLCQCGCGRKTKIAPRTDSRAGHVKGQHYKYLSGHGARRHHFASSWKEEDRGYTSPCKIWTGYTNNKGYGRFYINGGSIQAHVYSYMLVYGPVPDGLELDHLCRNKQCINADHLEPVTSAINTRRGVTPKLTQPQVDEIRRKLRSGARPVDLGYEYEISPQAISMIKNGRTWK